MKELSYFNVKEKDFKELSVEYFYNKLMISKKNAIYFIMKLRFIKPLLRLKHKKSL